jgi:hypothetical protein
MMLAGTISSKNGAVAARIGVERDRVVVVTQDDLSRFSWPAPNVELNPAKNGMLLHAGGSTFVFAAEMGDRFRWIMTAALDDAVRMRPQWWRIRKGPAIEGLVEKIQLSSAAA